MELSPEYIGRQSLVFLLLVLVLPIMQAIFTFQALPTLFQALPTR
jgi:hypothetical protein